MPDQSSLNLSTQSTGPVECLGRTFPSEDARRDHYLKLLTAKLKDAEFRKIEGFPVGTDEAILSLSDPPYYTACPNPWTEEFIKCYGTPYDPKKPYHREPFAADVSEGKTHPLYNAHSYHTKVPHRAIMRYILHYTEPAQVVFDGFCGTGMTGVAAQLCGDRTEVQALGYRVLDDGTILNEEGKPFSKLGARRAFLNDLSPAATFIANNYNTPWSDGAFDEEAARLLAQVNTELDWMYRSKGATVKDDQVVYTVWSEIFLCPECSHEINFLNEALDEDSESVLRSFPCPHCAAAMTKTRLGKVEEKYFDATLKRTVSRRKRRPTVQGVLKGKKRIERPSSDSDLALLEKIAALPLPSCVPTTEIPYMHMTHERARMEAFGITHLHQFFFPRAAHTLGYLWERARAISDPKLRHNILFWIEQSIWGFSLQNRYMPRAYSLVNRYLSGIYYIPSQTAEPSPTYNLGGKASRLRTAFSGHFARYNAVLTSTSSTLETRLPDNSMDYLFVDPPFGENIYYGDLNYFVESWHGVLTNSKTEAIIDKAKEKRLSDYQNLMAACFREFFRVLKPGRWITVEFSNSQAAVWNAIQTTMQEAGFVVANVAALDKQQRSYRSVTSPTAVKQDLVISAYKPNGGLEARFSKNGATIAGVWDFMRTHLRNLPVVKAKGGQLEPIAERDPRILHDRMVAFYVGHSTPVPLSSAEFQAELGSHFVERDGMWFLPEQVSEYDKKRAQMESVGQLAIFVEDERSAIDWLRNELKEKPRATQDVQPDFMQQLNASWKKWEARPELSALLDQNFLCYDGTGEVPSQIHSYLSTQFKELRNLAKAHDQLRQKGRDRWYVPDPKKNVDIETIRNKRLLEEFWGYLPDGYVSSARSPDRNPTLPIPGLASPQPKVPRSRKLKQVRTEAVRVGFKHCYQLKDYPTILAVAEMLPESVLNEDEQLQMLYDNAAMRANTST